MRRAFILLALTSIVAVGSAPAGAVGAPGSPAAAQPAAAEPAAAEPVAVDADDLTPTPPMGFNNWNATFCRAEFNESMVKSMADIFVSTGLRDAGYEYVNMDDCWARPQNGPLGSRDAQGHLVPDPVRFPNGIKAVADYVHSRGLKFGIYHDAGTKTCNGQGFDGVLGQGYVAGNRRYEQIDAQDFANWGVDLVKHDWCNVPLSQVPPCTIPTQNPPCSGPRNLKARELYRTMRDALDATGRPIVFQVATLGDPGVQPWEWAADIGAQYWRTTGDIRANYTSMSNIAKFNMTLADYQRPGRWNDADMLQVGNAREGSGTWTLTEQETHFSLWSIMASPLLIGTDLRRATPETMDILLNKDVIAVNQDPLGVQGRLVRPVTNGQYVLAKPLENGDIAVALWNDTLSEQRISTSAVEIGFPAARDVYLMKDLWSKKLSVSRGEIAATVPPHGTVVLRVKLRPGPPGRPPVE